VVLPELPQRLHMLSTVWTPEEDDLHILPVVSRSGGILEESLSLVQISYFSWHKPGRFRVVVRIVFVNRIGGVELPQARSILLPRSHPSTSLSLSLSLSIVIGLEASFRLDLTVSVAR
jgi:hypothetical protein